ncbi:hypothetical protein [Desulfogranum marinum]|nr:hypothetical protein [Desulfogranum marinum]
MAHYVEWLVGECKIACGVAGSAVCIMDIYAWKECRLRLYAFTSTQACP